MYVEDDHSSSKRILLIIIAVILLAIIIFLLLHRCGNNKIKISQINLTPTRLNLKVGEQQKIYANIFPTNASNSNVTWSIGDTNIATVDDNGLVTGVSDGTTLVVATANDDSGIVGSATVTVGNELPELEQIQLNRSTYTICVGKSVMVELTPVPSTASLSDVQYSILDTSIATVDSTGRIKGIQVGNTTITIKANDGKVTTIANVRVVASSSSNVSDDSTGAGDSNESNDPDTIIPVSTINLTATETCYRLKVGSTYIIGVEVLPSNATDKTLTWEVVSVDDANDASKNKVAEAYISVSDTGVVKGLKEGNARIKITAKSGFYAYFNINVISSGNEGYCSQNSGGTSGGNTGTGGGPGDNTGSNTGNNTGSNTGGSTGGNTSGSTETAGGKCTVSSSTVNIKNGSSTTITINCSSTSKGGKNSNIKYDTCSNVATVTPSGTKNVTSTSFSETVTITGKSKGTCTIILPEGYGVFENQKTTSQIITVNVSDDNTTGGNTGGNTGTAGGTCTVSLSTVNIKNGGTTTVTVKCSSTSSGSKNSNISNTCSNIATVSSSGAKGVTNTSFSEIITITGKSKGTCKINLPEGYGLFGGKKTTAQTIIVNVSDDSTTGGNIDSTIKKPTISFLCGSKTYSSSCSTNVTASITGGTKGTDYDDIYVCLISGPKICDPTSNSIQPISASGEYTYCAAYVKNGKKGDATCANEIVKIDKSSTTTVKKPTVSFLCGSKAYSNSCSTSVTASITGGVEGTDYDSKYVCLQSGDGHCDPTSTTMPKISSSGKYTYCAAYVKNGKKSEVACDTKDIKIIAPVEETATITIDTSSKNIRVFAPIGSIVTFSCLNANCGNSYTMVSGQFTRRFTIEDSTILTTIIVSVTHNGKQLDKQKATIDGKPINTPTITAISNNKTYVSDTWTNSTIDIVLSGAADDEEYYHYNLPLASGNKETFSEQMNMPISYKICKKNNPTKCGHTAKIRLKIDKIDPTCQLSFDATNKTITATLQDNLSGIGNIFTGDYKESSSNKYVKSNITKSGLYTFVFFDAASNPGSCSIEIGERTEYMREKCDEYTSYELTGSRNNNTCWASGKAGSTYEYSTCTDWPIYHIKLPVNGKCSLYYEDGFSETKSFTIHFLESDTYTSFNSILNECRNRLKKVCDDYKSKDSDISIATLVSSGECNKYIITDEGNKLQRSYKATKCNKFVLESDWQTAFLRCDNPIVCHVETRTILYSK